MGTISTKITSESNIEVSLLVVEVLAKKIIEANNLLSEFGLVIDNISIKGVDLRGEAWDNVHENTPV